MENAEKALRIAGGILLALLVVGILVFGFTRLHLFEELKEETTKNKQITEFNKKFETYNKKVVKGYEMISLANLAEDMNEKYSMVEGYTNVHIYLSVLKNGGYTGFNGYGSCVANNSEIVTADQMHDTSSQTSYYDLVKWKNSVISRLAGTASREDKWNKFLNEGKFKNLYFQCTGSSYDQKSARIVKLYFEQIMQIN